MVLHELVWLQSGQMLTLNELVQRERAVLSMMWRVRQQSLLLLLVGWLNRPIIQGAFQEDLQREGSHKQRPGFRVAVSEKATVPGT